MKDIFRFPATRGFTMVELLVVISIVGILASIVYASFGNSRAIARDEIRKTDLKSLQLALNLYKAQNGSFPPAGCVTGNNTLTPASTTSCVGGQYIQNLVPDYIPALPRDPRTNTNLYRYIHDSGTDSYKIINENVEVKTITNINDEFARCPVIGGPGCLNLSAISTSYGVYSAGAAQW